MRQPRAGKEPSLAPEFRGGEAGLLPEDDAEILGVAEAGFPGDAAVVCEGLQDPKPAVQFSFCSRILFDPLHIFYVLFFNALTVSVQRIKWGEDLGTFSSVHLWMLQGESIEALVPGTAGYKGGFVFESSG